MADQDFRVKNGLVVGANASVNNTLTVGGTVINSSVYAGTANNATYLNGQLASYYTNATNISSGTLSADRLATSGVTANVYGNSSQIPVITVDTYGRVTNVSTSSVAGVTSFTYTAANATFTLGTGDSSTYTTTITAANATVAGVVTVLDSVTNTSITIAASANSAKNAYDRAIDANTRAASAQTAAISAYSNATTFASNASNITTGTLPYAQIPANVTNTTSNFTISGAWTFNANVTLGAADHLILSSTSGISANGTYGSDGQVLTSNGSTVYWATAAGGGGSVNTAAQYTWTNNHTFSANVTVSGNVGVGTSTPGYKLEVNGSFAATTKSFIIDHPTKEGMKLRYGSLEGPENGVYVRGRLKDTDTINLPDYWTGLVDDSTITVNLTPIGEHQNLYVKGISNDSVIVGGTNIDCYYTVFAERSDVEKLMVEF